MVGEDRVVDRDAGDPHGACLRLSVGGGVAAHGATAADAAEARPAPTCWRTTTALRAFAQVVEARGQHLASSAHAAAAPRPGPAPRRAGRCVTARRTSAPFSITQTWSWPDAVADRAPAARVSRVRVVGQLDRGQRVLAGAVASPSGWRARSSTPIERVPASAAGAMRASRPATGSATPSTRTCTGMPGARRDTSCVPTRAGQLEPRQVDDGQHRLLDADLLAGHDVALGDDAGDRRHQARLAQADARRRELRLRRTELGARRVEPAPARSRSAIGEMNCCAGQARVGGVLALGLRQRRLRRLDRRPSARRPRLRRSARSMLRRASGRP